MSEESIVSQLSLYNKYHPTTTGSSREDAKAPMDVLTLSKNGMTKLLRLGHREIPLREGRSQLKGVVRGIKPLPATASHIFGDYARAMQP